MALENSRTTRATNSAVCLDILEDICSALMVDSNTDKIVDSVENYPGVSKVGENPEFGTDAVKVPTLADPQTKEVSDDSSLLNLNVHTETEGIECESSLDDRQIVGDGDGNLVIGTDEPNAATPNETQAIGIKSHGDIRYTHTH